MPLDPSIFLTGAQLRAQQNAQTQNTINNFFDRLREDKLRQQQLELAQSRDYEGAYMKTLQAQAEGKQVDPKTSAMAQAYEKKLTAEVGQDLSGNLYQKYQPQLGGVQGVMDKMPTSPTNYIPAFGGSAPQTQSAMPPMPRATGKQIVDDLGVLPLGSNYQDVAGMPQEQRPAFRGVSIPADSSPKTRQAAQEAEIDLQKEQAKSDINIGEKYGTEKAAQKVESETQLGSMKDFIGGVDALINDPELENLPSGAMPSVVAEATNLGGVPNKQALAAAKFSSKYPVLLSQAKSIVRSKGEGSFTDADQALLSDMLPKDSDSNEVKLVKLKAVKEEINRLYLSRSGRQQNDGIDAELRRRGLIK